MSQLSTFSTFVLFGRTALRRQINRSLSMKFPSWNKKSPGATAAEAMAKATSILNVVGARGAKISITPANITASTTEVTVAVDIPMSSNGLITPRFTGKTTLHSQSTLRTERAE